MIKTSSGFEMQDGEVGETRTRRMQNEDAAHLAQTSKRQVLKVCTQASYRHL